MMNAYKQYNMPGFIRGNYLFNVNNIYSVKLFANSDNENVQSAASIGITKTNSNWWPNPIGPEFPKPFYTVPMFQNGCDQCCVQQLEASCLQQCAPHTIDCLPMCMIRAIHHCGPTC